MSAESRIGPALMSRRIELGISLEQAARDTNIRARMIEVLESADYSQYPPRGHAIGMLSSYARYLGMNSSALIEAFDAEYEDYEASKAIAMGASNARKGLGRFGERAVAEKSRPTSRSGSTRRRSAPRKHREGDEEQQPSKLSRSLRSEADAQDEDRYKTGNVRVVGTRQTGSFRPVRSSRSRVRDSSFDASDSAPGRSGRIGSASSSRRSGYAAASRRPSDTGSFSSRSAGEESEERHEPNFFGVDVASGGRGTGRSRRASSSTPSSRRDVRQGQEKDEGIVGRIKRIVASILSERRTRLIALAFTLIVIGVIIAASVLIGTAGNSKSGIIPVQGGMTNNTTTTDGDNAAHKTITTANGNPVTIKVEVAEGETSLISIVYDGANVYSGTAVGGQFSREFPVTESFTATFGNPGVVTVTENGNPIDIAVNEDGTGSLYINVQSANK